MGTNNLDFLKRQARKQTIVVSAWVVFVLACVLMAALEGFTLETLAENGNLTPWSYLPFISSQELPVSWYGIVRAPVNDWPTIRENLGGSVVDLIVYPYTPLSNIIASLDSAEALEYQVVFHIYDGGTNTNKPWYLDVDEQWVFPQYAIDMLQAVSDHPAIFAIYALHEPLDEGEAYVSVERQRELYQLLKGYTDDLPVYTDIGGLSVWEDRGIALTDGICDYCRTGTSHFRSDWTSEQCLTETLSRIGADLDTQQRLMPNSQAVFAINTLSFSGYHYPIRLPTPYELGVVKDYLCDLDQPMLYYPWRYSAYDVTLEDAPQLWPVIAQGCTCPLDKAVDQTEARVGDTLTYTLTVGNSGEVATAFLVTDTLDADTAFASFLGTSPGSYGHAANVITWTGTVSGMSQVQLAFQATISASALGRVTNMARFDGREGGVYTDTVTTMIIAPALNATKQVEPGGVVLAETLLTYTVVMSNTYSNVAQVSLSDTIPTHTIYVGGSAQVFPPPPAHNPPQYVGQSVIWNGDIAPGAAVTITFNVQIEPGAVMGTIINNVAWVDDLSDPAPAIAYQASNVVAGYGLYLPVVLRND
jgi:uncharacterized repeat protein (TIGR01451 family)